MDRGRSVSWVEGHPAFSHFVLAVALGLVPVGIVAAGLLPSAFIQLGALSGSVAGFLLAALIGGRRGVLDLLRRGGIWRVGLGWWFFAFLFPPTATVVALLVTAPLGAGSVDWSRVGSSDSLIGLLVFLIVAAGVGEEFGWRGFALPRVQARRSALAASLVVGTLHSLWHAPLFFIPGVSQYDIAQQVGLAAAFLGHTVLIVALAVHMAWIFNHTRGSVLLVAIYHGSVNAWNGHLDLPRGGLAGVWVYAALMVLVSVGLVLRCGPEELSRTRVRVRVGPGQPFCNV
jgi:uncharacterized protein